MWDNNVLEMSYGKKRSLHQNVILFHMLSKDALTEISQTIALIDSNVCYPDEPPPDFPPRNVRTVVLIGTHAFINARIHMEYTWACQAEMVVYIDNYCEFDILFPNVVEFEYNEFPVRRQILSQGEMLVTL